MLTTTEIYCEFPRSTAPAVECSLEYKQQNKAHLTNKMLH